MTLHDPVISNPPKSSTSFSLLKKRKKRKDLDKLIIGRQYRHIRTSSCQDFNKMSNFVDGADLLSSTDDTTTLLNSTDEGLEYSTNYFNKRKSKLSFCNYTSFLIFSCLVNIFTIIGCVLLAVLLFANKNNLNDWKDDKYHDISEMRMQFNKFQAQLSTLTYANSMDYINQTLVNHTAIIQSLEEKTNELRKRLITLSFDSISQEKLSRVIQKINELSNNDAKVRNLFESNSKRIYKLESFYKKLENTSDLIWISNITSSSAQIHNILFQPSDQSINTFPNETTAVLLSLSQYKEFLQRKPSNKP